MKKFYYFLFTFCISIFVQTVKANVVSIHDITNWTGEGTDSSAVAISWNDGKPNDSLVWGYRYTGEVNGMDMIEAVVAADPRLYVLVQRSAWGSFIQGFGYDNNNDGDIAITNGVVTRTSINGVFFVDNANWNPIDTTDHFKAGFVDNCYFSYTSAEADKVFVYSMLGASARILTPGSWDAWSYSDGNSLYTLENTKSAEYQPTFHNGVFFLNEDWFGHCASSINFMSSDRDWAYNIYQSANDLLSLGNTAQYGTIYGGNIYLLSKQSYSSENLKGGCMVVANAQTMHSIKVFNTLPDEGDSRAFLPINSTLAYVSTSKGILAYNLKTNSFDEAPILSDGGYGLMVMASNYVFAEKLSGGVVVYNLSTAKIETILSDCFSPVLSKDGNLWCAKDGALVCFDTTTFEVLQSITLSDDQKVYHDSYVWNAGALFSGNQNNTLYWGHAAGWSGIQTIFKLNLDDEEGTPSEIYDLSDKDFNTIYGASLRLRPSDDHLFMEVYKGFGDDAYKVVEVDADGTDISTNTLEAHYWFPALPIFSDDEMPVVKDLENTTLSLNAGEVDFELDISDSDSYNNVITAEVVQISDSAVLSAELLDNITLRIKPNKVGNASVVIVVNSNGQLLEKSLYFTVENMTAISSSFVSNSFISIVGHVLRVKGCAGQMISVYSAKGQLVETILIGGDNEKINLSLPTGIYIVKGNDVASKIYIK